MDVYFYILPMILIFVNGIIQSYYTYIFRGVFKADSAFFHFINAIILAFHSFKSFEMIDETMTGLAIAILTLIIFIVIYFKVLLNRIIVYNGSLEETIQLIEEKLERDHIPFVKNEFSFVNDLMKFEINGGREYIEVKYKKSWLNENYQYTMTITSKLKERGTLLEDIILDLRDMRQNRSLRRRMIVELLTLITLLTVVIFYFLYFFPKG